MANTTSLLPTSPLAVEEWLRELANPSDLLRMKEAGQSEYPYLFGLATARLAQAHAEYLRLIERTATLKAALDVLGDVHDFLDDQADVVDGDEGPLPNKAMRLLGDVEAVLGKAGR